MAAKGKQRADDADADFFNDDNSAFRTRMLHKLRQGHVSSYSVTAWCPCTGLIAYPAPYPRSASSISQLPGPASTSLLPELRTPSSPSICLTLPPLSSHADDLPQTSFTLDLPEAPGAVLRTSAGHEHISYLSFSPDGNYLAVFTSYSSDTSSLSTTTSDASIRFVLFQRGDEINTWLCTFDWDARRAKANLANSSNAAMPSASKSVRLDNDKVLDVKWMQKAVAPAHSPTKQARKRAYDALMDFSGTSSLTAVLGSNEILVVHLPHQAIQPQVYVVSCEDTSVTTQDLSLFGTSFSPLSVPLHSSNADTQTLLNGVTDSLGMNLNSAIPVDPFTKAMSNATAGTSQQAVLATVNDPDILAQLNLSTPPATKETRLAAIGPCSTKQKDSTTPDAPPTLSTELLVAFQDLYQPKILRTVATEATQSHTPLPGDTNRMLLDGGGNSNDLPNAIQLVAGDMQGVETLASQPQVPPNATHPPPNAISNLPDYNFYGQSSTFESGYGDINLSALDEMFDSDFGGTGGTVGVGSGLEGLSSTLDSINQDFASTFPSATEPDGAPSPTKKDKETPSASGTAGHANNTSINGFDANGSGSAAGNGNGNGTHISDSPSKSVMDSTTYGGSGSRGSSSRKGLGISNGDQEDDQPALPEILDGMLDGHQAEDESTIKLTQVKIEWTEYGILSVSSTPVSTITSQLAALSEEASSPAPGVITHIKFMSDALRQLDSNVSTLLAISMPLAEDQENQSSRIQSYTIAQEPFILSDAFSTLEGRKSDPNPAMFEGILEWSVKRHDIEEFEWLEKGNVLDLRDRHGDLAALIVDTEGAMKLVSSKNSALLPNHYPLSIAISPSGSLALACALDRVDPTQLAGKPALFKLQPAGTEMDVKREVKNESHMIGSDSHEREKGGAAVILQLSRALIEGLVQRKSVRDILLTADRLNEATKTTFLRESWNVASEIVQGAKVEQTRLMWPLLAIQLQLSSSKKGGAIIDDILQLSTCLRIMQDSKSPLRNAARSDANPHQVGETFHGDAVWPIIGHITWMFDLWDRIIFAMTSEELDKDWSTASFLIMHPIPRMLQQRLVRLIARFANYMMNLKEGAALIPNSADGAIAIADTEVAKTVLGDIIIGQRQKTQEWNNMLQGLTNKLGSEWTDDIVKGREALLTLQLPPELERTAREMAFGMKQKLLPLVNVSDRDQQTILQRKKVRVDRITSIAANSMRDAHRVCTLCAGIAHLYGGARINEWASSKRRSCICGGQWVIA